jgi:hypothetical protein
MAGMLILYAIKNTIQAQKLPHTACARTRRKRAPVLTALYVFYNDMSNYPKWLPQYRQTSRREFLRFYFIAFILLGSPFALVRVISLMNGPTFIGNGKVISCEKYLGDGKHKNALVELENRKIVKIIIVPCKEGDHNKIYKGHSYFIL